MRIALIATALLLGCYGSAFAQSGPATLRMLDGWRTGTGTHIAAFEITLEPGWKTYWRAPGDSGIPPRIDWAGSKNIGNATLHWPRPNIYDGSGTRTIGYQNHFVLPVELTPIAQGKPLLAAGEIEIGVCQDICVPISFRFQVDLSTSGSADAAIQAALALVPEPQMGSDIAGLSCTFYPISDGLRVTARLAFPKNMTPIEAIFEHGDRAIWISGAKILKTGKHLQIEADFVPPNAQPFAMDRSKILLTLIGNDAAVEIIGCPAG